jgi:gluconate 5-dehydrogenase
MSHDLFDIRGRRALVTGSSRGIGRALARGLLEAGCTVVLHARDLDALKRAASELAAATAASDAEVHVAAFDLTDPEAVADGVAAAEQAVGAFDILINNAGVQHRASLLDFSDDAWRRVLDTNLTSAFLVGRAVARGMVERRRGKIVNVCSLQAEFARPGIAPYAASKGGLKMLTRGMCADWGPLGLQINAIAPGYFETELTRPLLDDEKFDAWVRARTPAARWGRPDELIGALLFLASPASDFVNGQLLFVDGGMSAVV